jgi:predicted amidohydrolase YtcJ
VTHRYTLLVGGTILPGGGLPPCTAIAWAEGTVLALGTDDQVRSASRGDSDLVDLRGAFVVPIGPDAAPTWPSPATLEIGGRADLALLAEDPRAGGGTMLRPTAIVRAGHVTRGHLPPTHQHEDRQ